MDKLRADMHKTGLSFFKALIHATICVHELKYPGSVDLGYFREKEGGRNNDAH